MNDRHWALVNELECGVDEAKAAVEYPFDTSLEKTVFLQTRKPFDAFLANCSCTNGTCGA